LTEDSAANDRRPSWSPSGREIAFYSDRDGEWGVYLVPALGGSARKVLPLPGYSNNSASTPQWAADGTRLYVLADAGAQNFVIDLPLDTLEESRIALPDHESPRRWDLGVRPDGRRFAYIEAGGGGPELSRLWTIAASGADPMPLTDGRTNVWSPTWSADGGAIFYVSNRGGAMDLWLQRLGDDGRPIGEPLPVTSGLGIQAAALSPDARRLAYSRGGPISNVWRVPIHADRPATWADALRVTSERAHIEFLDVSPDGERLALSSDRRGNQDLWVLPTTGGEMTPLTTDPTPDWNPRWSPDGKQIAFYAYRSGNRDIWAMPAGGGPARQLTFHPAFDTQLAWVPGQAPRISFISRRGGASEVWVVSAEGGEPHRLTASSGSSVGWAPDGAWFIVAREGRLFRVAADGRDEAEFSTGGREPRTPRVSPDGRHVYFSVIDGPPADQGIWRLTLADGSTSPVTRLEGRRGRLGYYFAATGEHLYLTWVEDEGDIWVMDVASTGGSGSR
jgi:Tol biopolymer transport system component